MSDLSNAIKGYIVGCVAAAVAAVVVAALLQPPTGHDVLLGAIFGTGVALAWLFPIGFSFRKKIYVDAAPVFAAALTMSPGAAMATVGGGILVAYALRRGHRDPVEAVYNAAQGTLACGGAVATLAILAWDPAEPVFKPSSLLAFVAASCAMFLVGSLVLAGVIGVQSGQRVGNVWIRSTLRDDPLEIATHLSLTGVGLVAALVVGDHPWAVPILVLPVAAMLAALRHHAQLRERAEHALRGSQADLAEAQRIARLGSWDWDLLAESLVWSDQVFRILGLPAQSFAPSRWTLLDRVHPDDRDRVESALFGALTEGRPFSIDHRIVLVDGSIRTVHQQGEVLRDPQGTAVRMVGTILDITERKALEAQLAHRAFHDALTDLPNRALFADRLERALAPTDENERLVAVLFLDLDDFKLVNDGIGHDAGDRLLVAVAGRLRAGLPPYHLAARFGGDEFTILLDGLADADEAVAVARRLVDALEEPFTLEGHEVAVFASVGVAFGRPGQTQALALLRDADAALYQAKAAGKHGVAVFEPGMTDAAIRRLDLQADLRRAVERGELRLLYQPLVDLATGRMVGVEALVRWQHPSHGLVAPDAFLPLAEETGLVLPLGEWVLQTACADAAAWRRTLPEAADLRVGVNLSVRQLRQEGLPDLVAATLRETGLPADRLELEITEQVVGQDLLAVAAALERLRSEGVRLSLDDVGSGRSSLGHFQHLTLDAVKLDRAFIAGLGADDRRRAIADAVTGLAISLGIEVTAEGIETTEHLLLARDLGCHLGQGYRFARPLPAHEIVTLLERGLPFDVARNLTLGPHQALRRQQAVRELSSVG
jgi:diguanylate cyclase (GGDEF)-like protein/PAS domain S-box-containing protein